MRKLIVATCVVFIIFGGVLFISCAPQEVHTVSEEKRGTDIAQIDSAQVKMYLSLGWENYKNKQYDRAIEQFRNVLELDAQNEKAHKFLADAYLRHPDTTYIDSALALYENAIKKFPENSYFYAGLGYVYEKMASAISAQASGTTDSVAATELNAKAERLQDKSLQNFYKAIQLNDEDAASANSIGTIWLRRGKLDSALVWFERTTDIDSNRVAAWDVLAQIYNARNMNEKAAVAYRHLHRLKPDEPEYLLKMGQYLAKTGNFQQATAILQKYIAQNPSDYRGFQYMGLALAADGKNKQALEQLKKAEQINPNSVKLMCDIASTYKDMKKYASAQKYIDKGKKIDPSYGYIYIVEGEIIQQRAMDEVPEDEPVLTMEVKCQFVKAMKVYRKALRDPNWSAFARAKIDYLKPYIPTKEEIAAYKFINPGVKCGE